MNDKMQHLIAGFALSAIGAIIYPPYGLALGFIVAKPHSLARHTSTPYWEKKMQEPYWL